MLLSLLTVSIARGAGVVSMSSGKEGKRKNEPSAAAASSAAGGGEAFKRARPEDVKFEEKRCRELNEVKVSSAGDGAVLYWMSRDQRVQDNWALIKAQRLAIERNTALYVSFCLVPRFLEAAYRQYAFMIKGLKEVESELRDLNIPFHLLIGFAKDALPPFIQQHRISVVVTDFSPVRVPMQWYRDVAASLEQSGVPLIQVDAHNVVPLWVTSSKQEYGARTIRGKIQGVLSHYLTQFPAVKGHPIAPPEGAFAEPFDLQATLDSLEVDREVGEVDWATPGTSAGLAMLEDFCRNRLKMFADSRNDPTKNSLSNLSPWIHFGQISVQRCVLDVQAYVRANPSPALSKGKEAYVEEAVVRRELSDNFCFYNPNYDSIEGAADWAKQSLELHKKDKREYIYTRDEFAAGKTHDDLWNAAQLQMVQEGKMHGFLRMYWAKKILEWSPSPEEALATAIYLNDKYELDGRDPNGYVGCMWSIAGIHDQGWAERSVFGKIRFMNYAGCQRKFKVDDFVRKYPKAAANAREANAKKPGALNFPKAK
ncbi:unnamed protein product [Vitrella brassicaformis CCMP3155]|uniref:Deoxyribodipyrimidine photo-lyase n=1 Tax=Vitrella brassicaformis (strain CCMP3155) TaxID=1169540 RepID=A0A0G4EB90_VITBC|nr:unnamed protein product [Vitrella brassicaformis CCMP3155]|eukprot:CEL93225.1 unnamed protein product [Vitrella brassicaformis CCMP3155]